METVTGTSYYYNHTNIKDTSYYYQHKANKIPVLHLELAPSVYGLYHMRRLVYVLLT